MSYIIDKNRITSTLKDTQYNINFYEKTIKNVGTKKRYLKKFMVWVLIVNLFISIFSNLIHFRLKWSKRIPLSIDDSNSENMSLVVGLT